MKTKLLFLLVLAAISVSAQTTYYSKANNGDWNVNTSWTTSSTHAGANAGPPGPLDIAIIGGSDIITVPNALVASSVAQVIVSDDGTTCSLIIGNGANTNNATLSVSTSITVNNGGSITVGGSNNTAGRTGNLIGQVTLATLTLNGNGSLTVGNTSDEASTVSVSSITLNGTSSVIVGANQNASHTLTASGAVSIGSTASLQAGGNNGGTHTINFQSTLVNSGTITFDDDDGNNDNDQITMTVTSTTNNSGTITFGTNAGVKTFIGGLTNTGIFDATGLTSTGNLVFRGGVSSSTGSFTAGGATFNDVASNAQTIGGTGAMSFANVVTLTDGTTLGALVVTNSNSNTVTLSNTGAAQLTGSAGAVWRQGSGSTLSYAGSTITGITLDGNTNTPNTIIYTGATATIFPASYNNLTYSGTTTGTVATTTTVNVSGNLTSSSGTFTGAGTGTVVFNGSSTQTISGIGAFTFANITMSTGSSANVAVNKTITVNGTISWTADGLLVVGSSADIILGTAAAITTPGSNRHIRLDGLSGTNSNLIRTTTSAVTQWQFVFPIGTTTGGYTPFTIPTISAGALPVNNSTLSVKIIVTGDLNDLLKRAFRLTVAGNTSATTFSGGIFRYNNSTDLSSGDLEGDYTTVWRKESEGAPWTNIGLDGDVALNQFTVTGGTVASASLTNGIYLYAFGTSINHHKTWYSYQSGLYSADTIWTLDPSGTTLDNGLNEVPTFGDEIVILNGFTVTMNTQNQTLVSTTINGGGTLNVSTSTGHDLGTITGTGLMRVNSPSLPNGIYTDFVSVLGGTIEYYDIGGDLSTSQTTYNKLKMTNSTGVNITYVLASNMTVNGTFDLTTTGVGSTVTWQINNASNTQRSITLNGNLTLGSGGRITVGTGNEASTTPHALTMYGNITNNGIIKFYDPLEESDELPEANYGVTYPAPTMDIHRNELQGNAVTVTFSGSSDRTVTCNNTTDFYRFVLDKGTGQQAILTLNSSNTANFRLFGPADLPTVTQSPTSLEFSANALSIINGTLELTGSINIPLLQIDNSTAGYFPIPRNGALWLNGANVTVQISDLTPDVYSGDKDGRILMSGLLRITAGTLFDGFSKGLGSQDGGSYLQEGGTVTCWQFRPRVGGSNIFSFNQTGGTLNVGYGYALSGGKIDQYEEDYSRFDLNNANSTFQMSGTAVLNVAKPTNSVDIGTNGGLFTLGSSSANYSVTGGTVNLYTGTERSTPLSYPGYINTTVPFYNLNIYEESATTENAALQTNSLIVLNNLTINTGNTPTFTTNNLNVTVGGNFTINSGTTYDPGTGTTTFNGTGAQTWTHDGTISALASVVMNKSAGTLTLAGTQTFPNITTALTLTSGTLADGGKTVTVTGALTNNATHSGSGSITYSNGANSTISGSNGTFGNLTLTTNFTHSLNGPQTVTGTLRLTGNTILNIVGNSLTTLGNIYSDGTTGVAFASTKMIITNGFHNAGGLTRKGSAGGLLFPVGTGSIYTPNTIDVAATTHGNITVRPVNGEHPNVTATLRGVQYYWRVTSTGYSTITSVTHSAYGYSTATENAPPSGFYRIARFDATALTWATSNSTFLTSATPPLPTFNTGTGWSGVVGDQLDGEYTCGDLSAFGGVTTYYSKASGPWNLTSTWSNTGHGGANAASAPPCANCPVIIGDGATFNHTVTMDKNNVANDRSCGTLTLSTGSTLDCGAYTGMNFGTNTGGAVTGRGTLRINLNVFPAGDFTNFIGASGGTVEWYAGLKGALGAPTTNTTAAMVSNTYINVSPTGGTGSGARFTVIVGGASTFTSVTVATPGSGYIVGDVLTFAGSLFGGSGTATFTLVAGNITTAYAIPTTGPGPQNLSLATYYNLKISPNTSVDITLPGSNIRTYNDFSVNGSSLTGRAVTEVTAARTLTIDGALNVTGGTLSLANSTAGTSTSFVITGNTTISAGAAITIQTTNAASHTITTSGSITNHGGLDLYGGATTRVANITFTGTTTPVTLDGTNGLGADFSFITVNKGTSQTPTVNFSMAGTGGTTITATNNGTTPWLTLTNGTFNFNTAGSYDLISSTAGAVTFTIPTTAKLKVNAGTVNVITAGNSTADLFLNGSLEVSGGAVTVGNSGNNNNNDIEYASAGTPTINVSSGSLYVNGSIRRSTTTITGALVYNQTGGAVTVGGRSSNNTRGVFEIDANTGSSFTLTGLTTSLTVERQTGGTGYADIFINPITSNVSATSTITAGLSSLATNTNFRINIAPAIGNFTVVGTNAHTVNMFSNPMVLGGTLTINTPSSLVTNSLNVSIAGDLNCTGTYTGGTNTTTFDGTGSQLAALSSTSTFNDVTISKTAGTTLTLSGTSPTLQNLNILSGILSLGTSPSNLPFLDIRNDITNNSSQIGDGYILIFGTNGISNSITSSGGSFTNLTLGGTATTKTVSVIGDMTINGTLNFSVANRYLMIGSNRLTFGSLAPAVTGAGSTAFIRTNGVTSDLGVTRNWGLGTSTFIYHVGTSTNYTPVSFSLNVTTTGTLNVIPVNSVHPTYSAGEQILNYYWTVTKGAIVATATAPHTYTFPSPLISGSGGALVAGYLDGTFNPLGWTTSGHGGSINTPTNTIMTFAAAPPSNLPATGNYYDYSVGTTASLPNPILPLYSRGAALGSTVGNLSVGGAWGTAANWTSDINGVGPPSSVAPTGVPVVIRSGDRINSGANGKKAYKTTISGLLNNGTRTGHNLGIIDGTGTFRTATNTFPAGNYTAFVASTGGTIEYVAPMTMNSREVYNNLSVYSLSSGTVTMVPAPVNGFLTINGTLTVPSGVTLDNSANTIISIAGDWSNGGTYVQGTGTTTFTGGNSQAISGTNTFTGLIISKSTGNVTLSGTGSTTVTGSLSLSTGNIIASSTNILALGSATLIGGSATSFIAGPMTKTIAGTSSFTAPLGSVSAGRYRPATIANTSGSDNWSFEYVGSNPTSATPISFDNQLLNFPTLGSVSMFEYWLISRAGSTTANLSLTYGTGSYIPPNVGVVANLRVARWNGTQWDLPPVGGGSTNGATGGSTVTAGTVTVTNVTNFSPETIASTDDISPLPIELLSFTGKLVESEVELNWKTVTETDNDYFTVEKSAAGEKFSALGTVKGAGTSVTPNQYRFVDTNPFHGISYYRLKQTDFDGKFTYSNIISIDYNGEGRVAVSIYPNPANGQDVTIEVSGLKDISSLPISFSDQIGKVQFSETVQVDSATGTLKKKISIQNMADGVYVLKIGTSLVRRVVITK